MPLNPFILNDETVENSHGFTLLNTGGRFERFNANPVMFYNHNDEELPIGKWENLRVENGRLIADPVFDEVDEQALKIKGKVERGFLKGASLGLLPIKAEYIDGKLFVTEWEMLESSIVNIPSNKRSLKLYSKDGKLLENVDEIKTSIHSIITNQITPKMENPANTEKPTTLTLSVDALTKLGLEQNAEPTVISAAVVSLHARAEKAEKELSDGKKAAAENLVAQAIAEGRLTADKKQAFIELAITDFAQAQSVISAIPAKETLRDKVVKPGSATNGDRNGWSYLKWAKEDPKGLQKLKEENPQEFEALVRAYKENR